MPGKLWFAELGLDPGRGGAPRHRSDQPERVVELFGFPRFEKFDLAIEPGTPSLRATPGGTDRVFRPAISRQGPLGLKMAALADLSGTLSRRSLR